MPAKITLPNTINEEQSKTLRAAIIASAAEQVRGLLESHFAQIVEAAEDSFIADSAQSEPVANVSIALKFETRTACPSVTVRIGFRAAYKDESEQEIDLDQLKMDLETAK